MPRNGPASADACGNPVDEQAGKIFCLVEAPSAEAARAVHREAHGLVADEIYQVSEGS